LRFEAFTSEAGAFYINPPSVQPSFFANFLIYKKFYLRTAPEVVRIIGPSPGTSTGNFEFIE